MEQQWSADDRCQHADYAEPDRSVQLIPGVVDLGPYSVGEQWPQPPPHHQCLEAYGAGITGWG